MRAWFTVYHVITTHHNSIVVLWWFSPDVIAAMFVYRTKAGAYFNNSNRLLTKEKKVFGNLTLFLYKTWAIICYCFLHQHGRLIMWLKTICSPFLGQTKRFKLFSQSFSSFAIIPANTHLKEQLFFLVSHGMRMSLPGIDLFEVVTNIGSWNYIL